MSRFLERLADGPPVVADGGMGTLIMAAAGHALRTPEEANLVAAETVVSLHTAFIAAGAELIETNTFGANRQKLAAQHLDGEVARINSEAVKLAREAREISGRDVFIAGAVGPGADAEQVEALAARGVDLFMVETFAELDELLATIELVRGVSSLPMVVLLTFGADGETPAGVGADEAAHALAGLDVAAIGANHGAGPQAALTALAAMTGDTPLAALPNVGLAGRWGNRIVYPHADTDYFADFTAQARDLGARIVGGCCGTTPVQIEAIANALREERRRASRLHAGTRAARAGRGVGRRIAVRRRPPCRTLRLDDRDQPTERRLRRGSDRALPFARNIRARRVHRRDGQLHGARADELDDGVRGDRAGDGARDDPASHAARHDGHGARVDPPRRARRRAPQRPRDHGRPADVGDYPDSHGVYEVDSIGLCRIMQRLNAGESFTGKSLDAPTSFFCTASPSIRPRTTSTRSYAASSAKDRGRRSVRDHAIAVRLRRHRPVRAASRRLAGAGPARRLLRHELPARCSASTTRFRG